MRITYVALAACALFGLSLALIPTSVLGAAVTSGFSDTVTFTGSLIGPTPEVFNFSEPGESGPTLPPVPLSTTATLPTTNIFGMTDAACVAGAVCPFSDILSFTSSSGGSDNPNQQILTFTFTSDSESPLQNAPITNSCVEGTQGCGDVAFKVVDNSGPTPVTLLSVAVASDADVPGVPEPSTLLLMGSGLAGAAVWGRKALKLL